MCAYCEELKPLFSGSEITKNGMRSKSVTIQGRRIVEIETISDGNTIASNNRISDFELNYCMKCGKGLAENTMDVQRLREMDKR